MYIFSKTFPVILDLNLDFQMTLTSRWPWLPDDIDFQITLTFNDDLEFQMTLTSRSPWLSMMTLNSRWPWPAYGILMAEKSAKAEWSNKIMGIIMFCCCLHEKNRWSADKFSSDHNRPPQLFKKSVHCFHWLMG